MKDGEIARRKLLDRNKVRPRRFWVLSSYAPDQVTLPTAKMESIWTKLVMLLALVGVSLTAPVARSVNINSDVLYFPDQVDYIRASHGKCPGAEELFWPGDRRCYAEGEQGPCGFEFRLVWDERQLRPRCVRANSI